jgi:parallel beta-helix repeat protein
MNICFKISGIALLCLCSPWAMAIKFIADDPFGGDCAAPADPIGEWDPEYKTCTLTADINLPLAIIDSGVNLDCASFGLTGPGYGNGISIPDYLGDVTVSDCHVRNFYHGIQVGLTDGVELIDNDLTDNIARGILLTGGQGSLIGGNTISGSSRGIEFLGGNHLVRGNEITDADVSILEWYGSDNVIAGNRLRPSSPNGFGHYSFESTFTVFIDNHVQGTGNASFGFGFIGLDISENLIAGNHISDAGNAAILVDGSEGVFGNEISDNTIVDTPNSVQLSGEGQDNVIRDNQVRGSGGFNVGTYYSTQDLRDTLIADNSISNGREFPNLFHRNGMNLDDATGTVIRNNTVHNMPGDGLHLVDSAGIEVYCNDIFNNDGHGAYSNVPVEASLEEAGNYWGGHPGEGNLIPDDALSAMVTDLYPFAQPVANQPEASNKKGTQDDNCPVGDEDSDGD